MKKINWGVIGLGNIAQQFSDSFLETRNAKLLAISSNSQIKLEKFKKRYNVDKKFVFNQYEKLLQCEEIDVVYITLPHSFHYEWIIKSLESNKRVVVEKPATINVDEVLNVKKKVLDKKIFFIEGFMYRYHPQTIKIVDIIKEKAIGDLISIISSFGTNLITKKKFFIFNKKKKIREDNRLFNKKLGGGCILDLGCYPTSFSLLIASLDKNINCNNFLLSNIKNEYGETGVEIHSEAEIIFDGKITSKIKASFKNDIGSKSIIRGTKGSLLIDNTWHGGSVKMILDNKEFDITQVENRNIFSYQIESISKSILEGCDVPRFPGMKLEDTVLNMRILEKWKNA
jgi:predicted dehydrogenase